MSREFDLLSAAAARDDSWTALPYALGSADAEATINIAANSISSSMRPMAATHLHAVPGSGYVGSETIQTKRLDGVFGSLVASDERAFLKIDTQGLEREVLEGASGAIGRICGLQLETSFVPLYDGQMLLAESLEVVAGFGMVMEGIEPGFVEHTGRMYQMDVVAFRPTDGD
jgi:FkbM family methyltransferase